MYDHLLDAPGAIRSTSDMTSISELSMPITSYFDKVYVCGVREIIMVRHEVEVIVRVRHVVEVIVRVRHEVEVIVVVRRVRGHCYG